METTRTMKQRLTLGLGQEETSLRFKLPLYCDVQELDSVLDCYSSRPQGHWPARPKLVAPLKHYEACKKVLEAHPKYETVGEYLLATIHSAVPAAASLLELMLIPEE